MTALIKKMKTRHLDGRTKQGQVRMRRSSYGTVEFDKMVMSMIETGPAMSDVMVERNVLGDNEYEGGGEGKVLELGLTCVSRCG